MVLQNGTQANNVFWQVNGSVDISDHSTFNGTIVAYPGAITFLSPADTLDGRALSTAGAITTNDAKKITTSGNAGPATIQPNGSTTFCEGDSLLLKASNGVSYLWSTNATTQSITVLTSGSFSVMVTSICGANSNSAITNVTVNPLPIANAGNDKTICYGQNTPIGSLPILGNTYSWLPTDSLSAALSANPLANPVTTTTYALTEIVTASGCSKKDSVKITVTPLPIANAGVDKTICNGQSTLVGAVAVIGNTYAWLPVDSLSSALSANPLANPSSTTTYTLTVIANHCSSKDSVKITVNPLPLADVGIDKSICYGQSTVIGSIAVLGSTYSWLPKGSLNFPLSSQPTASPIVTTAYSLTETISITGCQKTNSAVVNINPNPLPDAGSTQTICPGSSVKLGSREVSGNSYSWLPAASLNSGVIAQPFASPGVTTTYTLTETTIATGCTNTDTVRIIIMSDPEFFNGFSPNGDSYNDSWNIPALNYYPTNSVLIINRWGSEVWKGIDYDNKTTVWTGKNMSGDDLPDGTYYYSINYCNIDKRGWVFIKR